jgi:hypothetical protein
VKEDTQRANKIQTRHAEETITVNNFPIAFNKVSSYLYRTNSLNDRGCTMQPNIKAYAPSIFFLILLSYLSVTRAYAQYVTEPPIPVYIVCPYHEDSLRTAFESSLLTNSSPLVYAIKRYDSLQILVQKSSAENTVHFTWLCTLIALLGTMNMILLFTTSRMRKELVQIKRLEQYQKLMTFESTMESKPSVQVQEVLFDQEPVETHKPARTRKTPVKKPHTLERN